VNSKNHIILPVKKKKAPEKGSRSGRNIGDGIKRLPLTTGAAGEVRRGGSPLPPDTNDAASPMMNDE
jgi:hypothetical protein